ncbi:MAG: four helix bundle protein [Prevotella sp.]|nr:four helix bundle protein [Prevotella sp.]
MKDFISKMHIALKEANETKYWLQLLHESGYIEDKIYDSMILDNKNIIGTLVNIIKSAKS